MKKIIISLLVLSLPLLSWAGMGGGHIATDLDNAVIDDDTHAQAGIDWEHHEIHEGDHFYITSTSTMGDGSWTDYLVVTPDTTKYAHMTWSATGSAITDAILYEGSDKTGVVGLTEINSNRNSSTLATVAVSSGTTGGTTNGTVIWELKSGGATQQSRSPMAAERNKELILKRNTKYVFRLLSGTAANLCNLRLDWYEHQDL